MVITDRRIPNYDYIIDSLIILYKLKRNYSYTPKFKGKYYDCPDCHRTIYKQQGKRHHHSGACTPIGELIRSGYLTKYKKHKVYMSRGLRDLIGVRRNIFSGNVRLKQVKCPSSILMRRMCTSAISGFRTRQVPVILHDVEYDDYTFKELSEITSIDELHTEVQKRIAKIQLYEFPSYSGGESKRVRYTSNSSLGVSKYLSLLTGFTVTHEHNSVGLLSV